MILILYQHHILCVALLCDSRTKPIFTHTLEDPSWKLMSKGERESSHQSLIISKWGKRDPSCLVFKEERIYMSLEGKDMFMFANFLCSDFFSVPYLLPASLIQYSGGARHLREGNPWIHCISLPLGTCLYPIEYSVLILYMSSQSWYSCGFFCLFG